MKKEKSKNNPLGFFLQNDLQWNVVQVAIDHMIEHLSDVASGQKGKEKKETMLKLKEAFNVKYILGKQPAPVQEISYGDLLDILGGLKGHAKSFKDAKMFDESKGILDLHSRVEKLKRHSLTLYIVPQAR